MCKLCRSRDNTTVDNTRKRKQSHHFVRPSSLIKPIVAAEVTATLAVVCNQKIDGVQQDIETISSDQDEDDVIFVSQENHPQKAIVLPKLNESKQNNEKHLSELNAANKNSSEHILKQFSTLPAKALDSSNFKRQMVLLQKKRNPGVEVQTPPSLLEVHSNCEWEPIRANVLKEMARLTMEVSHPGPQTLTIGDFAVQVLPQTGARVRVPPSMQAQLQKTEMYPIQLRITPAQLSCSALATSGCPENALISNKPLAVPRIEQNKQLQPSSNTLNRNVSPVKATLCYPLTKPSGISGLSQLKLSFPSADIKSFHGQLEQIKPASDLASTQIEGVRQNVPSNRNLSLIKSSTYMTLNSEKNLSREQNLGVNISYPEINKSFDCKIATENVISLVDDEDNEKDITASCNDRSSQDENDNDSDCVVCDNESELQTKSLSVLNISVKSPTINNSCSESKNTESLSLITHDASCDTIDKCHCYTKLPLIDNLHDESSTSANKSEKSVAMVPFHIRNQLGEVISVQLSDSENQKFNCRFQPIIPVYNFSAESITFVVSMKEQPKSPTEVCQQKIFHVTKNWRGINSSVGIGLVEHNEKHANSVENGSNGTNELTSLDKQILYFARTYAKRIADKGKVLLEKHEAINHANRLIMRAPLAANVSCLTVPRNSPLNCASNTSKSCFNSATMSSSSATPALADILPSSVASTIVSSSSGTANTSSTFSTSFSSLSSGLVSVSSSASGISLLGRPISSSTILPSLFHNSKNTSLMTSSQLKPFESFMYNGRPVRLRSVTVNSAPLSSSEQVTYTASSSLQGVASTASLSFQGQVSTASSSFQEEIPTASSSFQEDTPTASSFQGIVPTVLSSFQEESPIILSSFQGVAPTVSFQGVVPTESSTFQKVAPTVLPSFHGASPTMSSSFQGMPSSALSSVQGVASTASSSPYQKAVPTAPSSFQEAAPAAPSLLQGVTLAVSSSFQVVAPTATSSRQQVANSAGTKQIVLVGAANNLPSGRKYIIRVRAPITSMRLPNQCVPRPQFPAPKKIAVMDLKIARNVRPALGSVSMENNVQINSNSLVLSSNLCKTNSLNCVTTSSTAKNVQLVKTLSNDNNVLLSTAAHNNSNALVTASAYEIGKSFEVASDNMCIESCAFSSDGNESKSPNCEQVDIALQSGSCKKRSINNDTYSDDRVSPDNTNCSCVSDVINKINQEPLHNTVIDYQTVSKQTSASMHQSVGFTNYHPNKKLTVEKIQNANDFSSIVHLSAAVNNKEHHTGSVKVNDETLKASVPPCVNYSDGQDSFIPGKDLSSPHFLEAVKPIVVMPCDDIEPNVDKSYFVSQRVNDSVDDSGLIEIDSKVNCFFTGSDTIKPNESAGLTSSVVGMSNSCKTNSESYNDDSQPSYLSDYDDSEIDIMDTDDNDASLINNLKSTPQVDSHSPVHERKYLRQSVYKMPRMPELMNRKKKEQYKKVPNKFCEVKF